MTKINKIKNIIISGLFIGTFSAFSAMAQPPYDQIPEGMSEETYSRMMDNVIEWDEVDTLVRYFNPVYTKIYDSANSGIQDINAAYGSFVMDTKDQLELIDSTLEELKKTQSMIQSIPGNYVPDTSNPGSFITKDEALAKLEQGMKEAEAGRDKLNEAVSTLGRSLQRSEKSLDIKLSPLRKQLDSVIEGLLISYEELRINHSMVAQQVKLYETLSQTNSNLSANDMATSREAELAKNNLELAKNSLKKLEDAMNSLAASIGLQLGWSAENIPQIAEIPVSDMKIPTRAEYEAEKEMAVKGNPDVVASGKASGGSGYEYYLRDMTENEAIAKASSELDAIYADLEKKKILYDSSISTLEKAELTRQSNQTKYELGMLGRAEYEAAQMTYISYEASARLAAVNLLSAVNNYNWAMQGILA
ncbi:MAG: hypothetical protein Q4B86_07985 [Eubacteriales bacterium]|nr:hypothetical protein [Eubacteriales bacterium]